ncbi:MAG: hypothetical protein Q8P18_13000 [Pseudomonadota bacterium]|nr:hypothetical protein [Pseudomonadota bacterium]
MILLALSLVACAPKHDTAPRHDTPVAAPRAVEVEEVQPDLTAGAGSQPTGAEASAVATLSSGSEKGMGGAAAFTQSGDKVKVSINLSDATPGSHVVSLREFGGCTFTEPAPGTALDDLATLTADAAGVAHMDLTFDKYKLAEGDKRLVGRAVVVDGGKACGVIQIP